jgi:hypothetical protein
MGVGSDFLGGVKTGAQRSDLSHAVSVECEAVSVVDEPVEDGNHKKMRRIYRCWACNCAARRRSVGSEPSRG